MLSKRLKKSEKNDLFCWTAMEWWLLKKQWIVAKNLDKALNVICHVHTDLHTLINVQNTHEYNNACVSYLQTIHILYWTRPYNSRKEN